MLSEEDLKAYTFFKQLIVEASLNIEGKAVIQAALAFKWFEELEPKLKQAIQEKKVE